MPPAAMSGPADLSIRLARPEERETLEALQRRASLALGEYNEQLEAEPDAIQLPIGQIERGEVIVAELDDRIAGFAAVVLVYLALKLAQPGTQRFL